MPRISSDMGAHKTILRMIQGDSFTWTFTLRHNGEAVDFTNCDAVLQVRENFGNQELNRVPLLELTEADGVILGGETGVVTINLTPQQTQELGARLHRTRFQLRVVDRSTLIAATILRGEIRIERSVIIPATV